MRISQRPKKPREELAALSHAGLTDRKRAEEAARFQSQLLGAVTQAVIATDLAGRIIYWNPAAEHVHGWTSHDALGRSIVELIVPDEARQPALDILARLGRGDSWNGEFTVRRKNGEAFPAMLAVAPVVDGRGDVVGAVAVSADLTEQKRTQDAARAAAEEAARRIAFLAEASALLGASLDYEATLKSFARLAVPQIADICVIEIIDAGQPRRVESIAADPSVRDVTEQIHVREWRVRPDADARVGQAVLAGEPVILAELSDESLGGIVTDAQQLELVRLLGVKSAMMLPLRSRGRVVGVISLATSVSGRRFTQEDLALAQELALRAAVAVDNATLYEGERRARAEAEEAGRRVAFLAEASTLLAGSLEDGNTLQNLARLVVPRLADWCAVDVVENGRLRRVAVAHVDPKKVEWVMKLGRRYGYDRNADIGPAGVLRSGRSVLFPEITEELLVAAARDAMQLQILREAGLSSAMFVPMVARGRTLGVITLVSAESRRRFTGDDLTLAEDLAHRAATALDNAELFNEVQETADHLLRANAAKDEFLGLVSHELRTPITTIYGNAQVLLRRSGHVDEQDRQLAIADIEQEAERLQRIVENMLTLARVETGMPVVTEPLLVHHVIDRLVSVRQRRYPRRNIAVHVEPELDPVAAEPTYFEQILRNLLSNAEKYSPPDAPIEVRAVRDGDMVAISVLDCGSGIAPEEAGHIFNAFYRSSRTAGQASGAGMGLAVCKRLVEAQSGRIWAKPRERGGSEIGFALPVDKEAVI